MKLKHRDWTEVERRFGATGSELMQEDKTVRAAFFSPSPSLGRQFSSGWLSICSAYLRHPRTVILV
jgi:hypothetical protein